ncbi:hypothetical protein FACS189483_05800 [Spirochaetia bacterium]|nr:hypothetical protein FACS189483_05800 [Spirochaetia bacterium]
MFEEILRPPDLDTDRTFHVPGTVVIEVTGDKGSGKQGGHAKEGRKGEKHRLFQG